MMHLSSLRKYLGIITCYGHLQGLPDCSADYTITFDVESTSANTVLSKEFELNTWGLQIIVASLFLFHISLSECALVFKINSVMT